jgi:hypothetical protein
MKGPSVAIVLASIDARATIAASVRGFLDDLGDRGRLIVADGSRDGSAELARAVSSRVEVVTLPPGSLAPVLWREGMLASDAEIVAFSTAQMMPHPGHLDALLAPMTNDVASAVGGPIAAGRDLSAVDRAMYLLRYANYLPPVPESATFDPPGDNAAYLRRDLDLVADSWRSGFWEIDVHRRLRALGRPIATAHQAVVEFVGGCSLGGAMSHRLAHARRFGSGRAEGRGLAARLARSAAAPVVPPLLLSRILRNLHARGEPIGPWLPALPFLGVLLSAWSLGEAAGAILGPGRGRAA